MFRQGESMPFRGIGSFAAAPPLTLSPSNLLYRLKRSICRIKAQAVSFFQEVFSICF